MNSADVLKSLFEIILVAFTIWALFHEDRFIAFEDKLFSHIRRKNLKILNSKNLSIIKYPADNKF
ncbi:MAG: hypothetical protein MJ076_02205 [Clostridia bacterium]|nr:hypothetical protein [Clostridia bacterium]